MALLTLAALIALTSCWQPGSRAEALGDPEPQTVPAPEVTVVRASSPQGPDELLLPGTIEAWQETLIYARIDGYVRRWHLEIGDHVEAGALLAEIDAPEIDQAAAQAIAAQAQARANLELARTTYARWRALVDKQTVSAHELDERRATFDARKADLSAANAKLQRLREMQEFKRITAPFSGVVTVRNVEHGALIEAGSDSDKELYRVAEVARLRIRLRVPQASLRAMQPGVNATVLVAEFPDRNFAGRVTRTAGALDPASRTLLTEIELSNQDGTLLPGLYAQVRFNLPHPEGTVLVPTNAIRIDAAGARVAAVGEDSTVKLLPVSLGRNLGTQMEVLSGLSPDTRVVLNPGDELEDGLAVLPKEAELPK